MSNFYKDLSLELVEKLDHYSKLNFQLREMKKHLLKQYEVEDIHELLDKIIAKEIPVKPAYDHYVSYLFLDRKNNKIREALKHPFQIPENLSDEMMQLRDMLEQRYANALQSSQLFSDALIIYLDNGIALEIKTSMAEEYVFNWQINDIEMRIDTAPIYPELSTYPHHIYLDHGQVIEDKITNSTQNIFENTFSLIDQLLEDPLLTVYQS